jgi:hypothetical protein
MPAGHYLITYREADRTHKLCRVWFGGDGSLYVTSPYHPATEAVLVQATVNYSVGEMEFSLHEAIDVAGVDDPERRLKLSHHPDGFIQFSGEGVLSGRNPDGSPKGVGVMSWPLDRPVRGPALGVTVVGVERFAEHDERRASRGETVVFDSADVPELPGATDLRFEAYYFPAIWRRFVRVENGQPVIGLVHPAGVVIPLRVLFPQASCERQAFLGVELYRGVGEWVGFDTGFLLSSSTGNLRRNDRGEWLGDALYCMYPREGMSVRRSADYRLVPEPEVLPPREQSP